MLPCQNICKYEISPYYENNMKVTLRLYETKSIPATK